MTVLRKIEMMLELRSVCVCVGGWVGCVCVCVKARIFV